jgi:hypothetical protein
MIHLFIVQTGLRLLYGLTKRLLPVVFIALGIATTNAAELECLSSGEKQQVFETKPCSRFPSPVSCESPKNAQKNFSVLFDENERAGAYSTDESPCEQLIIRGQTPQLLSQALPLISWLYPELYPGRMIDNAESLFVTANRFTSEAVSNRSGRFRADYTYDSSGLSRVGGNLMLSSALPLALDTEFYYREREIIAGGEEEITNGDVNVIYRLNVNPRYKFRTGAGVNWREIDGEIDLGFNTTYGLDFTLYGPWLFSAVIDLGLLGDDTLFRWRITTGVVLGNLELFVGYDDYKAGDDRFNGILGGAGFWF